MRGLDPALEVVVRSGLRTGVIRDRLGGDVQHYSSDTDFGLVMHSPFTVDRTGTLARYQAVHERFDEHVDEIASLICLERCELVLANVGYLAIAAAKCANVPAVACSSLNWSDLFEFYCAGLPGAEVVGARMDEAYRSADFFARLEPGMPMERFKTHPVARPIARVGRRRRTEVADAIGVEEDATLVLCAFAGMLPPEPPPFAREPDNLTVLGPAAWSPFGVIPTDHLAIPFADLMASVDGVVTKPGYGTVAELGCMGVPTIMVSRHDWPEEPHLLTWLTSHGRQAAVAELAELSALRVGELLAGLADGPIRLAQPGGEMDMARMLVNLPRATKDHLQTLSMD